MGITPEPRTPSSKDTAILSTPQTLAQAGVHASNGSTPERSEVSIPVSTGIGGEKKARISVQRGSPERDPSRSPGFDPG